PLLLVQPGADLDAVGAAIDAQTPAVAHRFQSQASRHLVTADHARPQRDRAVEAALAGAAHEHRRQPRAKAQFAVAEGDRLHSRREYQGDPRSPGEEAADGPEP